jgi:hypothetical protein
VGTRLWLTAHPVEFLAEQVARTCRFGSQILQAFLTPLLFILFVKVR